MTDRVTEEQFERLLKSIYELKRDINSITPPSHGTYPIIHMTNSVRGARQYMQSRFPEFEPPEEIHQGIKI